MIRALFIPLLATAMFAQACNPTKAELLWPDGAPGALGTADADKPSLTPCLVPEGRGTGSAIVICPGGGMRIWRWTMKARKSRSGSTRSAVAAFVLQYRLGPRYHHPIELGDAQRAIRTVRAKAAQYRVLPDRIGIMGFSAGGHLASTAATHFDPGKPDAADMIDRVPAARFRCAGLPGDFVHHAVHAPRLARQSAGAEPRSQAGREPLERIASHRRDAAHVPFPHQQRSGRAGGEQRALLPSAAQGRRAGEMHIYEQGPHGVGLATTDEALSTWPARLAIG